MDGLQNFLLIEQTDEKISLLRQFVRGNRKMIKNSSQNNDYLEGIEISNEAIFLDPENNFPFEN